MADKLWRVSQVLGVSPFSDDLLNHNEAQLDFILQMFVKDNPKEWRITRHGMVGTSETEAAWANVVTSPGMMQEFMPSEAVLAKLRHRAPVVRVHPSIAGKVAALNVPGMNHASTSAAPASGNT